MALATELDVRLRNGFYTQERYLGSDIEDQITLDKRAYDVISLRRNNVAITQVTTTPATGEFQIIGEKIIKLGDVAASGDIYDILTASGLQSSIILSLLDQATAVIRATLHQFGEARLDGWESPGPVPPLIIQIATDLAGNRADRSFIRANQKYDPDKMTAINTEYNRILKQLDQLASGQLVLVGEPSLIPKLITGGGGHIFRSEQNMKRIDKERFELDNNLDGRNGI